MKYSACRKRRRLLGGRKAPSHVDLMVPSLFLSMRMIDYWDLVLFSSAVLEAVISASQTIYATFSNHFFSALCSVIIAPLLSSFSSSIQTHKSNSIIWEKEKYSIASFRSKC